MNWTGGTRMRHSRSSSDTTRLQKRFFARVRAAQNPALSFSHASSFSALGDGIAAVSCRKRRRPAIPTFDIVFSREGDVNKDSTSKRRKLLKTSPTTKVSAPYSGNSVGRGEWRANELKSKKQLLLEKDDWVCTTLARPLDLGHRAGSSKGNKCTTAAKAMDLLNPGIGLSFAALGGAHQVRVTGSGIREYNPTDSPSLEKTYVNVVEDGDRRFGGAFRDLSDGGYVQIGGSTQCGMGATTSKSPDGRISVIREMSGVSEETMLFDLDCLQEEHRASFRPTPFPAQSIPEGDGGNRPGRQYQIAHLRDDSKDMVYYETSSRRSGRITGEFPSSPLAAYSRNIVFKPFMNQSPGSAGGLVGEIEEAAADVVSSSPSTALSTIYLRSDISGVSLPPSEIENFQENPKPEPVTYNRYPNRAKYATLERGGETLGGETLGGLSCLLQKETVDTQGLSLVAYASSSGTSSTNNSAEDGENWILGSNVSPQLHETPKISTEILPQAPDGGWERFLRNTISQGRKDVGREHVRDDIEKYWDGVGIRERQSDGNEEALIGDRRDHGEVENYEDIHKHGHAPNLLIDLSNNCEKKIPRGFPNVATTEFLHWLEEERRETPWETFITGPFDKPSVKGSSQNDTFYAREARAVNDSEEPLGVLNESIQELAILVKAEKNAIEKPAQPLDLSSEEDRAWRMFVFDGLDYIFDEERSIKAPESPKQTVTRKASLNPISQLAKSTSSEPQLPSLSQHSSLVNNLDLRSTTGATAGSGSSLSSDGDAFVSNFSAKSRSKYFDAYPPSPLVSPVLLVCAQREVSDNKNKRKAGEPKPVTFWLRKHSGKNKTVKDKGMKKDKREGEREGCDEADEVDEIEEFSS